MKTISEKQNVIIAITIMVFSIWYMKPENGINKCQETHSFETCFEAENP